MPPSAQKSRLSRRCDPAALRPQPKRTGPDHWATPACLRDALIHHVLPSLPSGPLWECAAGNQVLAKELLGNSAIPREIFATDLHWEKSTDFLTAPPPHQPLGAIVTNPPFSLLDEFIARGLRHLDTGAARSLVLLWRWDHPMAACRGPAILRAATIHLCQWRPQWLPEKKANGRWAFAWLTWRADYGGPPVMLPVQRSITTTQGRHENGSLGNAALAR